MVTKDSPAGQRLARGIAILAARHGETFEACAVHDRLCAGGPNTYANDAESDELDALGWYWNEREESWEFAT